MSPAREHFLILNGRPYTPQEVSCAVCVLNFLRWLVRLGS